MKSIKMLTYLSVLFLGAYSYTLTAESIFQNAADLKKELSSKVERIQQKPLYHVLAGLGKLCIALSALRVVQKGADHCEDRRHLIYSPHVFHKGMFILASGATLSVLMGAIALAVGAYGNFKTAVKLLNREKNKQKTEQMDSPETQSNT